MSNDLIETLKSLDLRKLVAQAPFAGARGSALPWTCRQHPNAQIRHTWDETHCVLNGHAAGEGIKSKHRYECAECGQELAAQNAALSEAADKRRPK